MQQVAAVLVSIYVTARYLEPNNTSVHHVNRIRLFRRFFERYLLISVTKIGAEIIIRKQGTSNLLSLPQKMYTHM